MKGTELWLPEGCVGCFVPVPAVSNVTSNVMNAAVSLSDDIYLDLYKKPKQMHVTPNEACLLFM